MVPNQTISPAAPAETSSKSSKKNKGKPPVDPPTRAAIMPEISSYCGRSGAGEVEVQKGLIAESFHCCDSILQVLQVEWHRQQRLLGPATAE